MALIIEPSSATFTAATGGKTVYKIVSQVDTRMAFKIRSSNNEHYTVNPVYGFVEAKQSAPLEIIRLPGPANRDKLVIQWAEVSADEKDPMAPFKAGAQSGEVILPLAGE